MLSPRFARTRIAAIGFVALAGWLAPHGAADAATVRAHWGLNELSGSTAFDDSGNHNDGTSSNVVHTGAGYTFNGVNSGVTVPDSPSLSPGTSDFSFSVTLTTSVPAVGTDFDLLRKGLSSTVGGEYKVEILNVNGIAKAYCLVKDANKHVAAIRWAPAGGLADNQQHTITCSKTSTGVTLRVDNYAPRTKVNSLGIGSVANDGPLFLGTKSGSGGDPFAGTLYDATVS
jgi:hypothetical protein